MRYSFRDKLLLSFAAVLMVTVVPVLALVNTQIESISSREIAQSLQNTKAVFRRFQTTLVQFNSERASTLILTQPQIRAEIATAGLSRDVPAGDSPNPSPAGKSARSAQADDPFGAQLLTPAGNPAADSPVKARAAAALQARWEQELNDRTARIQSIVQEVSLYESSDIFFLTDFKGRLVFNKVQPRVTGVDLSKLPAVLGALQGDEVFTWWGTEDMELKGLELLPKAGAPVLYQLFLKPVVFGGEVKGVIGFGLAITRQTLDEIAAITQSELAFVSKGTVYINSLAAMPAATFRSVAAQAAFQSSDRILPFTVGGEELLALPVPVTSSLREDVGQVIVYRSKTREQEVFEQLKRILNIIGVSALVLAGLLAFFISHSVSGAVRRLVQAVNEVRSGNLGFRVKVRSRDEFGNLENAFNEMTAGLQEKEAIRDTFKRYVSSSVVDELLRNLGQFKLGGENKPLTIQFSDIAAFTSLSEAMTPEQVVEFLNEYLSAMTEEVEAQQGIVDKYIGDAVMAFWGTPVALENHALNACRSALGQVRRIRRLRESWADRGSLSRFSVRIGLHSGRVIVGNIGSATRMDYTIIGDAVNTASRLEGMNKLYGTEVLLSEDTYRQVESRMVVRELDRVLAVGKTEPLAIYELAGEVGQVDAAATAHHSAFAEALAIYRSGGFLAARDRFREIAQTVSDGPSLAMARRCEGFLAVPPPAPWKGVFVLRRK